MVEEIVGEIPDEHESKADPVKEPQRHPGCPGNMDVTVWQSVGFRPEDREATTVAGLVTEIAGRIPQPGEVVTDDGLKFEMLDSTDRKVLRVRIDVAKPAPQQQMRLNIQ